MGKAADYLEELTNHRLAKKFDQKTSLYITMEALCGNEMDAKALQDKVKYLDELIESQKLMGTDVLWALGAYLDMNTGVKRFFAQQLKVAYEQGWAEETTILSFYNVFGLTSKRSSSTSFQPWRCATFLRPTLTLSTVTKCRALTHRRRVAAEGSKHAL